MTIEGIIFIWPTEKRVTQSPTLKRFTFCTTCKRVKVNPQKTMSKYFQSTKKYFAINLLVYTFVNY